MAVLDLTGKLGFNIAASQRAHYWFDAGGKKFGYCYIRKNGCSAFKDLITKTSVVEPFESFPGTPLNFMNAYHKIEDYRIFDNCDQIILVYRDPYMRLVSAYANKFVARSGNKDIFQNYRDIVGSEPEKATFREFVSEYCKDFGNRDPHIRPQLFHCLPIRYNLVIKLEDLCTSMESAVGPDLAGKYFSIKNNETVHDQKFGSVIDHTSEELHRKFLANGLVPTKDAFFSEELLRTVKNRYECDYDIILDIERPPSNRIYAGIRSLGRALRKLPFFNQIDTQSVNSDRRKSGSP